jgi:amino acid transporter
VAAAVPQQGTSLARGAVGLREVIFQSITHMAPAAAVAFSIPSGIAFGNGATPLAVIFALIGCLFVAISIGQLARHLPSAGSFSTYTSKSLHPGLGFLIGWGYAFVEPLIVPILMLNLGFAAADFFSTEFGWDPGLWWPWAIAGSLLVFGIGYLGVKVSTRTGSVLGAIEIAVFALIAVWLIGKTGSGNTLAVFGTKYATNPDFKGMSGVIAASVFTILAFIGFEAAAPLAEEARNPRRTIPRAVVGPTNASKEITFGTGWLNLGRAAWGGVGFLLVFLAIVNSTIANANAGSNAATRTWYALGRIRLLPSSLARVHPTHRSPSVATVAQLVVGIGVSLWLGFQYDPITAFALLATTLTVFFVPMYMILNISCIAYYWRHQRGEFNPLLHVVIPVLGVLVFIPAFFAGAGLPVFSFIPRLPYPISLAGLIMGSWMILGIVYLVYLSVRDRDRIRATERVFLEEDPEELRAGEEGPALSPGSATPAPMHADGGEPPPVSTDPPPTPTDGAST